MKLSVLIGSGKKISSLSLPFLVAGIVLSTGVGLLVFS